jgi:hypothetical protein
MTCPVCEEGTVLRAQIRGPGETIYVCDECEALWHRPEQIMPGNAESFGVYLQSKGLRGRWDELEHIESDWSAGSAIGPAES